MSIINSLAVRGAKKSMGGITYTQLKGQNVSKQQVGKKGNILPHNMSLSQRQMYNINVGYRFLSPFLTGIKAKCRISESIFNAFVRIYKNEAVWDLVSSGSEGATVLLTLLNSSSNYGTILTLVKGASLSGTFSSLGMQYAIGSYVRYLQWNYDSGLQQVSDIQLSAESWASGVLPAIANFAASDFAVCYIYTKSGKLCSNILGSSTY